MPGSVVAEADDRVHDESGRNQGQPGDEHRSHGAKESFPVAGRLIEPRKPALSIGFMAFPPIQ